MSNKDNYLKYLLSNEFKQMKQAIINKRGYMCENCFSSNKIDLHHKNNDHINGKERAEDLILLCRDCHNDAHKDLECFL